MTLNEDLVYRELVELRQGRALRALNVSGKLGPVLRGLCGIADTDDDDAMARKASTVLAGLAGRLPDDQRSAALIALGLLDGYDQRMYGERIRAATQLFDREERAVKRRIDEALRHLARRAVIAADEALYSPVQPGGRIEGRWKTESLYVALSLESPVPEAFERRTVVALVGGLVELDLAISVPSDSVTADKSRAGDLAVDVFRGGTLLKRAQESSDRIGLILRLPKPLQEGERHDICLRYRARLQIPHYACIPRYPCHLFELSVRFGSERPAAVYLLNEVFQDDARDTSTSGLQVPVDMAGETRTTFRDLRPGFAYGVRWT